MAPQTPVRRSLALTVIVERHAGVGAAVQVGVAVAVEVGQHGDRGSPSAPARSASGRRAAR